jgi:hypothetical protein
MARLHLLAACSCLVLLTAPITLHAQDTAQPPAATPAPAAAKPAKSDDEIKFGSVLGKLISPDSPGFIALGVAASDVAHPETPKKLALGILNGLDQNGNFQNGFAVQFSPALLFGGRNITLQRYQTDLGTRLWTRLDIAAAVSKGSDKDKSARATIGFVWTPVNLGDPYANIPMSRCFGTALRELTTTDGTIPSSGPILQPPPEDDDFDRDVARSTAFAKLAAPKIQACIDKHLVKRSRTLSLQVGFSPVFVSETGNTGDFKGKGYAASGLFSIGIDRLLGRKKPDATKDSDASPLDGQLILAVNYRTQELTPDPANEGKFLERDRFNAGGRLLFGALDSYLFGIEAMYQNADYRLGGRDNYVTYAASLDFRIADNLWLGANLGGSSGNRVGGSQTFIGTRFRAGFNQKPTLESYFK